MKKIHHNSTLWLVVATILAIIALHTTVWPSLASARPVIQRSPFASHSYLSNRTSTKRRNWYWYSRYFLIQRYLRQFRPDIDDLIREIQDELKQDDITIIPPNNFKFKEVMQEALKLAKPLHMHIGALGSPFLDCQSNCDFCRKNCSLGNIPLLFWVIRHGSIFVSGTAISGENYQKFLTRYIPTAKAIKDVSIIEDYNNVPSFDDKTFQVVPPLQSGNSVSQKAINTKLKSGSSSSVSQRVINIELKDEGQFCLKLTQSDTAQSDTVAIVRIRIVRSSEAQTVVSPSVVVTENIDSCSQDSKGCCSIANGTFYLDW
jgi:hypothetical protein